MSRSRSLGGGLEGLTPHCRSDRGSTKLPAAMQERLLAVKQETPRRSCLLIGAER